MKLSQIQCCLACLPPQSCLRSVKEQQLSPAERQPGVPGRAAVYADSEASPTFTTVYCAEGNPAAGLLLGLALLPSLWESLSECHSL